MKYSLLINFLFIQLSFSAAIEPPVIGPIAPYALCDSDANPADGRAVFNLTSLRSSILMGQSPSTHTLTFYTDAAFTNVINTPSNYTNTVNPQTIYVKVTHTGTGESATGSFDLVVYPLPNISTPMNFSTCDTDGNNNGYHTLSLNEFIPGILNGLNPSNYTIAFYNSLSDAVASQNVISNPATYQTFSHVIYARVENVATGCMSISQFRTTIEQYATPAIQTANNSNTICVDYTTNAVSRSLTLNAVNSTVYPSEAFPTTYSYKWFVDGVLISGATGPTYTIDSPLPNRVSAQFSVQMESTLGCSIASSAFTVFQSGQAAPVGIGYSIVNSAGIQTLTVEVQGYGIYQYAIDNGARQSSPVFTNVSLGTHIIQVFDTEGGLVTSCNSLVINNIEVSTLVTPTPTGNTTQTFSQGATLANILVNGQNIQWYDGATKNAMGVRLPLNTVLVNGVTYFASQKIGGYESISRLPVLAQVILNTEQHTANTILFYPNPVTDKLTVSCDKAITAIHVYSILGQLVLSKNFDQPAVELKMDALNAGTYFMKVQSADEFKTVKIIKE